MMEENLFAYVESASVKYSFTVFYQKKCHKKKYINKIKRKERVTPEWTDISDPGPISFLSRSSTLG